MPSAELTPLDWLVSLEGARKLNQSLKVATQRAENRAAAVAASCATASAARERQFVHAEALLRCVDETTVAAEEQCCELRARYVELFTEEQAAASVLRGCMGAKQERHFRLGPDWQMPSISISEATRVKPSINKLLDRLSADAACSAAKAAHARRSLSIERLEAQVASEERAILGLRRHEVVASAIALCERRRAVLIEEEICAASTQAGSSAAASIELPCQLTLLEAELLAEARADIEDLVRRTAEAREKCTRCEANAATYAATVVEAQQIACQAAIGSLGCGGNASLLQRSNSIVSVTSPVSQSHRRSSQRQSMGNTGEWDMRSVDSVDSLDPGTWHALGKTVFLRVIQSNEHLDRKHEKLRMSGRRLRAEIPALRLALADGATRLSELQRRLRKVQVEARAHRLRVGLTDARAEAQEGVRSRATQVEEIKGIASAAARRLAELDVFPALASVHSSL